VDLTSSNLILFFFETRLRRRNAFTHTPGAGRLGLCWTRGSDNPHYQLKLPLITSQVSESLTIIKLTHGNRCTHSFRGPTWYCGKPQLFHGHALHLILNPHYDAVQQ